MSESPVRVKWKSGFVLCFWKISRPLSMIVADGFVGFGRPFPMTEVQAVLSKAIIKKKTKKITRIQSDVFKRVKPSWRHTRGIDSRFRRKYRGTPLHPSVGFGSDRATKGRLPNGYKPYLVHSVKDLEPLFTQNNVYAAVVAHSVGSALRRKIEQEAENKGIFVCNAGAHARKQEQAA
jgi:large subunit ribosomal protein L32e